MATEDPAGRSGGARCAAKLRVRYGECDPQGVVFNAHYLAYFDVALTELFRAAFGSYRVMIERGVDLVVAEAGLRYRRPAHFDDELTLEVTVSRLGTSSMTTSYEVLRGGELLVGGTLRHVCVDPTLLAGREAGAKTAIPEWMREGLAPYLDPRSDSPPADASG
jgi:acyl-CoA thioester hydrolase